MNQSMRPATVLRLEFYPSSTSAENYLPQDWEHMGTYLFDICCFMTYMKSFLCSNFQHLNIKGYSSDFEDPFLHIPLQPCLFNLSVSSSTAGNESKKLLVYSIVSALPHLSGRKGSLIQMGIPSAVASKA